MTNLIAIIAFALAPSVQPLDYAGMSELGATHFMLSRSECVVARFTVKLFPGQWFIESRPKECPKAQWERFGPKVQITNSGEATIEASTPRPLWFWTEPKEDDVSRRWVLQSTHDFRAHLIADTPPLPPLPPFASDDVPLQPSLELHLTNGAQVMVEWLPSDSGNGSGSVSNFPYSGALVCLRALGLTAGNGMFIESSTDLVRWNGFPSSGFQLTLVADNPTAAAPVDLNATAVYFRGRLAPVNVTTPPLPPLPPGVIIRKTGDRTFAVETRTGRLESSADGVNWSPVITDTTVQSSTVVGYDLRASGSGYFR